MNFKKSQKESMEIKRSPLNVISIKSYQSYTIQLDVENQEILNVQNLRNKYQTKINLISQVFKEYASEIEKIIDIGCSNGFYCYLAKTFGISEIVGLDHDVEYIQKLQSLDELLNQKNGIRFERRGFGERGPATDGAKRGERGPATDGAKRGEEGDEERADLVVATALIHWLFSYTTDLKSLDKIIEILAKMSNKFLLIEWISPNDKAIHDFKHFDYKDPQVLREYNEGVFTVALKKHFSSFVCLGNSKKGGSRKLYLAKK